MFYNHIQCQLSFSSLATCRSFCDNKSHMLLFKSKNKHIKKTFHCCRHHNLPFLSTIIPSTSPQLSTDIRALWSTDTLVWYVVLCKNQTYLTVQCDVWAGVRATGHVMRGDYSVILRQMGMCCSNGSLFYKKSLNMGPVFYKKKKKSLSMGQFSDWAQSFGFSPCENPPESQNLWKMGLFFKKTT